MGGHCGHQGPGRGWGTSSSSRQEGPRSCKGLWVQSLPQVWQVGRTTEDPRPQSLMF